MSNIITIIIIIISTIQIVCMDYLWNFYKTNPFIHLNTHSFFHLHTFQISHISVT